MRFADKWLSPRVMVRVCFALALIGPLTTGCGAGGSASPGPSDPSGASPSDSAEVPKSADHPLLGAPAPEVSLPDASHLGGARVDLSSSAGRVRLLDFWATWCEPCRLSFPRYEEIARRYGDKVAVLAVSEDDESAPIVPFGKERGVHFPLLWDQDKGVSKSFSVDAMPTLFIIDKNGLVRHVHSGFREGDERQIDAVIRSLLE